eukprot:scaffold4459_cov133-Chaetoceros_neogracile.AAC.1
MEWVDLEVMELDLGEEKENGDGTTHGNERVNLGLLGSKEDHESITNVEKERAVALASAAAE